MATLGNKKTFSGMVGNVVFKNLNGKQIVQSHPGSIKQTNATKISASEFGKCNTWTKHLRNGMSPFLVGMTDSIMHSRFSTAVYTFIKSNTALPKGERTPLNSDMSGLHGFEFNTRSPFENYFKPQIHAEISADKKVTISISGFNPKTEMVFPNGCTTAKLVLYIIVTDFKDPTNPLVFHSLLPIDKNSVIPSQVLLTTPSLPEGHFVLASAKLLYFNPNLLTETTYLNTKDFSPAKVVLAETIGG